MNTNCPWGEIQHQDVIADGIDMIMTAGHGGILLSPTRHSVVKHKFPKFKTFAGGPWYEEDCDVVIVILTFPEVFKVDAVEQAKAIYEKDKTYFEGEEEWQKGK